MLERVLEPEAMDTPDEARNYNRMDHAEVNRLFVDDLLATGFLKEQDSGRDVLDLGTGTALIPIELCRRGPDVRVMAVDLSINMLELARLNVEAAGLIERIQLQHTDAKSLGHDGDMFDAVISNSIVHHIPRPQDCLAQAKRVVKTGGRLFFRDLLRPETQTELDHLVSTYTGDENEHAQQMFRESLHAALSFQEIQQLIESLEMDPSEVKQTSDRHWTWSARRTV